MPPAMPPQEWDAFWGAVECCMLLQAGAGSALPAAGAAMYENSMAGNKRARTNRCGQCVGCTRGDCGTCKNCRDKPKFGGPGVKKQACVRRSCCNPQAEREEEDEEEDEEEATHYGESVAGQTGPASDGVGGFMSGEPSPETNPAHAREPPAWQLDAPAEKRARHETASVRFAQGAGDRKSEMQEETRRRLAQLRGAANDVDGRESSLSMGYSTADELAEVDDYGDEPKDNAAAAPAALSRAVTVAAAPMAAAPVKVVGAPVPAAPVGPAVFRFSSGSARQTQGGFQ